VKNYREEIFIRLYFKKLEEKTGWSLTHSQQKKKFQQLSHQIFDKIHKNISISTLKKISSGNNFKSPEVSHGLEILSMYLGYENWMHFKAEHKHEAIILEKHLPESHWSYNKLFFVALIIVTLIFSSLFIIYLSVKSTHENLTSYEFKSQNPNGKIPFNVKFNFDFSKITADSIFIKSGDRTSKHKISRNDHFLSHVFFNPGNKKSFLIFNDKIVDSIITFAFTDGWVALIANRLDNHPALFPYDSIIKKNKLQVTENQIWDIINYSGKNYFVNFYNVRHFNVNADDCTFEIRVRNKSVNGGDICQRTNIGIIGSKSFVTIPLLNSGCAALARLYYANKQIHGWTTDLSMFSSDLTNWVTLNVNLNNNIIKIHLNNELIYTDNYTQSIGEFQGFRIEFQGCGEIDYVQLRDGSNQLVINDDFGGKAE